jgi:hypothetical protein
MNDDLRKMQIEASTDMFKIFKKRKKKPSEDQVSVLQLKYWTTYETAVVII